jgi:protein-L-isoaspartate(D-aspartate) O-methyltransferase
MTVEEARQAYAEEIRAVANLQSRALVDALARVPRERFLGPGPWQIAQPFDRQNPYRTTADAGPEHVYHDVVVAIDPARKLNNGQPAALATWIDAVAPRPGESLLHIGCGTGYYTAIMAELVGLAGRVRALEIDPALAARAGGCLAGWPQVDVVAGDGSELQGEFDVIFVNAGTTHARGQWLAALRPGGRMLLPLTARIPGFPHPVGVTLRLERAAPRWGARVVTPVSIYDCAGARDEESEQELRTLLAPDLGTRIGALVIEAHSRGKSCVYHRPGFCLQSGSG